MTDTSKLLEKIEKSGYKRKFIAEKIGRSYYSLQQKINNDSQFTQSEIVSLCNLLSIDENEVNAIFFTDLVE